MIAHLRVHTVYDSKELPTSLSTHPWFSALVRRRAGEVFLVWKWSFQSFTLPASVPFFHMESLLLFYGMCGVLKRVDSVDPQEGLGGEISTEYSYQPITDRPSPSGVRIDANDLPLSV